MGHPCFLLYLISLCLVSKMLGVDVNMKEASSKRMKHLCPVSKCKKAVVHLPRHLREVHRWSPTKSKSALSIFDIRKKTDKKAKGNKPARIYRRRVCPFIGCSAVVRRLHNHLQGKHKLKREDERYGCYNASKCYWY